LHLQENRQARLVVEARCALRSLADFSALGYMVGQRAADRVPYFRLNAGVQPGPEELKALGAAMAASGAVALFHVQGVTPETRVRNVLALDAQVIKIESLEEGYESLDGSERAIDLVWIGCPHASLAEIERAADELAGRELKAPLWITTARDVLNVAKSRRLTETIEACGGRIVADACLIGAPLRELNITSVATNSGKGTFYLRSHQGLQVRFGSLVQCVESAVAGRWLE
jgi:predicted aconitase